MGNSATLIWDMLILLDKLNIENSSFDGFKTANGYNPHVSGFLARHDKKTVVKY
jgi:hypothetical protein